MQLRLMWQVALALSCAALCLPCFPPHPPAKLSVRQTYIPCAFMSMATSSSAAMLVPPPALLAALLPCTASRNREKSLWRRGQERKEAKEVG